MTTDTRPPTLPPRFDAIPAELHCHRRWVGWAWALRRRARGEPYWTKPPLTAARTAAAVDDAATWTTFATIRAAYEAGGFDGVGIVLIGDGLAGVDWDGAIDATSGAINPLVLAEVRRLDTYTEVSPSGRGLRAFVTATMPGGKGRNWRALKVEAYDRGRFLTVTGHHLAGTPTTIDERSAVLHRLIGEWDTRNAAARQAMRLTMKGAAA
jgi:primase-polymerase (primpol)-like protein